MLGKNTGEREVFRQTRKEKERRKGGTYMAYHLESVHKENSSRENPAIFIHKGDANSAGARKKEGNPA